MAELPFLLFIAVADATESVGTREADAFFSLLQETGWAHCPQLVGSLPAAAKRYPDQWKHYLAGEISKAPAAVMRAVMAAAKAWPPSDSLSLEEDLLHIVATLRKAAGLPKPPLMAEAEQPFAALGAALGVSPLETPTTRVPITPPEPPPATPAPVDDAEAALIAQAQPWKSVRTRLRCVRTTDETADVRTFSFIAEPARPFCYKPGQFMTLEVEIAGRKIRRSYTISSTPSRPYSISITVKRVPGGLVSNWLHDHLVAGGTLQALVANGKFNTWDVPAPKLLLLSAGSGITPVMAIARWQFDLALPRDTVFFHCARTPDDIIFRRELEGMESPIFRLVVACTRLGPGEAWPGPRGRLDAAMLRGAVPDYLERVVFMCGPAPWMEATKAIFQADGFPMQNFHQESFGLAPQTAAIPESAAAQPKVRSEDVPAEPRHAKPVASSPGRVIFSKSHLEVACEADEPILEVAERSGIQIPSSCRAGACGTCKVIRKSGVVKHDPCPGLLEADLTQGYVVTCVGLVEGTVILDV